MVAPDSLMEPPKERSPSKDPNPPITNGNEAQEIPIREVEETHKPPSYVALACCISGYTTLVYDSKQRQGLHTRTASPIRIDGFRNSKNSKDCGFLTPNSRITSEEKMQTQGLDFLNGCAGLHSPRHVANMKMTKENINYSSSMVSESYSSYSSASSRYSFTSSSSLTTNGTANGSNSKLIAPTNISQQLSPSSFIVQRVERLYGPGALAQGFYAIKKNSTEKAPTAAESPVSKMGGADDSPLPVLKLLRPEFRAQLTVASRKGKSTTPEKLDCSNEVKEMENLNVTDDVDATAQRPLEIASEENKDGRYFLKLLSQQVNILEGLAKTAEQDLNVCHDNEEACGILRAAAGKARLLIAQKLNQFKGLCQKNIEQSSSDDFPTTNEDLAGFWDMVMIQVDEIVSQFNDIKILKGNNWKPPLQKTDDLKASSKNVSTVKKIPPKKVDSKAKEANRLRDEARRKLIEERRKAMKDNKANTNGDVIVM